MFQISLEGFITKINTRKHFDTEFKLLQAN